MYKNRLIIIQKGTLLRHNLPGLEISSNRLQHWTIERIKCNLLDWTQYFTAYYTWIIYTVENSDIKEQNIQTQSAWPSFHIGYLSKNQFGGMWMKLSFKLQLQEIKWSITSNLFINLLGCFSVYYAYFM